MTAILLQLEIVMLDTDMCSCHPDLCPSSASECSLGSCYMFIFIKNIVLSADIEVLWASFLDNAHHCRAEHARRNFAVISNAIC